MPSGVYSNNKRRGMFQKGMVVSDETKKKMSLAKRGKGNANFGKTFSEETRNKMRMNRLGSKHSLETKLKMSLKRRGENHPNWIHDRTKLAKKQERNDTAYKEWRRQVWLRDNFKCKIANPDCCGKIEAHHILEWSGYPELRYETNNGITLCQAHHPKKRAEVKRLSPYFQELVSKAK